MVLLLFLVLGFVGMEIFSWVFHKYVMHGLLWFIHKTHHIPQKGAFELNDCFSLLFGALATLSIVYGLESKNYALAGVGFGVTSYGLVYFVLHDVAIHNRIKNKMLSRLPLFDRIRRAHKIHHKSIQRRPSRSFGLLFVRKSVFHSNLGENP
jgi:beta-carotene 3-hydroxylase